MRPFDRSKLPPEILREHKPARRVNQLEADTLKILQNPITRGETAIHEGAHFYYRKLVGDDPFFTGPHFRYFPTTLDLTVCSGGVASDSLGPFKAADMARWNVAGWLWEEYLTNSVNAEDGAAVDRADYFDIVHKSIPGVTDAQIQECWDAAIVEVRNDLLNKDIETEIRALANEFEKFIVPWIEP
jgi:hypothetical protein